MCEDVARARVSKPGVTTSPSSLFCSCRWKLVARYSEGSRESRENSFSLRDGVRTQGSETI